MQLYEYIGWKFAIFNVYRLSGIKAGRISPVLIPLNLVWDGDLVKQVRTPPVRPADGVVGCVYESFVPGVWHRWMEKEILWFCFRRAEPERMISGWTASSRDSSKTEEGKAPRGYGQIRSELRMSSKLKLSRILPL